MHLNVALTCSFCFPVLILDVTDEMLSFFLTLFQGLRVQMGVPFTEQIIQTFLNMFTRYCPMFVTSFLSLRMIYLSKLLTQQVSAPKKCSVYNPFVSRLLSRPRTKSEENASKSEVTQPMHINHTCHHAISALPQTFWKCVILNWTLALPVSSYPRSEGPPTITQAFVGDGGGLSILSQNPAPFGLMYLACIN